MWEGDNIIIGDDRQELILANEDGEVCALNVLALKRLQKLLTFLNVVITNL